MDLCSCEKRANGTKIRQMRRIRIKTENSHGIFLAIREHFLYRSFYAFWHCIGHCSLSLSITTAAAACVCVCIECFHKRKMPLSCPLVRSLFLLLLLGTQLYLYI